MVNGFLEHVPEDLFVLEIILCKDSKLLLRCGCRDAGPVVWPESYGQDINQTAGAPPPHCVQSYNVYWK